MHHDDETWNSGVESNEAEYLHAANLIDVERQHKNFLFDDIHIRRHFIQKVYLILMAQLLLTLAIVIGIVSNETMSGFIAQNQAVFWLTIIVLLVTMLIMTCCDKVRRQTPLNYIFLGVFTVAQSLLLAVVTCQFNSLEILYAVGTTALTCLGLSMYALQTKYDFTIMGGVLLMGLIIFVIFGIVLLFFPTNAMMLVHSSLGTVLFGTYLIYDTQLMIGGQHKFALNPEEYVYAALNLYLDIVNVFLYILPFISFDRA